jgi:CubicO group peptidase (beta-lactamase class C family)
MRLRLSVLLLAPSVSIAQVPTPLSAPASWPAFTTAFQAYVDSDRVVGASVVLVRDGRVIARYDAGDEDRAAHKRVDDQTIYHWGSITKTLTAISIMQLRDRGKLALDDKVVRWVPELRLVHDPYKAIDSITIRMLLSHTAGFQNPTWPYTSGKPWEPFEPTTWNQLVAMMPYQELHFRPGTQYSYSNPGFIYLARIIEQITGDPWDAYVQKNIFAPLSLDHSYFRATPYYLAGHRSHNYYVRRDSAGHEQTVDNGADFDPGVTTPNGGWNAPLADLVKYLAFLTNASGPGLPHGRYDIVLARSSLQEMWRPVQPMAQSYEAAPDQWMGLSFFILRRGGQTLLGHTGSQAGFRSFLYFNPQNSTAIIAAFNTTNTVAPATSAFERVRNAALDFLGEGSRHH